MTAIYYKNRLISSIQSLGPGPSSGSKAYNADVISEPVGCYYYEGNFEDYVNLDGFETGGVFGTFLIGVKELGPIQLKKDMRIIIDDGKYIILTIQLKDGLGGFGQGDENKFFQIKGIKDNDKGGFSNGTI